jgi:hypothetical protein
MMECAEVGVLYNDADTFGVRFHKVPRALFELIPGDENAFNTALHPYWTKIMFLADGAGNKLMVTMYCDEPLLSGIEPVGTGEHSPV